METIRFVEIYIILRLNQRTPTNTPIAIWVIQILQWTFRIINTTISLTIKKKKTQEQDADKNEWKRQENTMKELKKLLEWRTKEESTNTEMFVGPLESPDGNIQ